MRAEVRVLVRTRDEDARRDADDERRHLRDETVADREQRVLLQRLQDRHALLRDADRETADDIDQRDEDARDRVASDELRGTVHRAVKVRLLLHLQAAFRGGGLVDEARVEFRINAHLLAGQRIEREARRDFRDAARALRDDHEIDHDQNQEHDRTDDVISTHDEGAERLDDRARVSLGEDEARRGDVQCEPVKCDREK